MPWHHSETTKALVPKEHNPSGFKVHNLEVVHYCRWPVTTYTEPNNPAMHFGIVPLPSLQSHLPWLYKTQTINRFPVFIPQNICPEHENAKQTNINASILLWITQYKWQLEGNSFQCFTNRPRGQKKYNGEIWHCRLAWSSILTLCPVLY